MPAVQENTKGAKMESPCAFDFFATLSETK